MPPRSDIEHVAAYNAMQLAEGKPAEAKAWYKKLLPGVQMPAKPSKCFRLWAKQIGCAVAGATQRVVRLGRPKKIPDHKMLAIAKGPLQRVYYSHGVPYYPMSVEEVSTHAGLRALLFSSPHPAPPAPVF